MKKRRYIYQGAKFVLRWSVLYLFLSIFYGMLVRIVNIKNLNLCCVHIQTRQTEHCLIMKDFVIV